MDLTTSSAQLDKENAMLLLIAGALMEASERYDLNPQIIINEISDDFSTDGLLNEKGDDWFIRLQAVIKNDPKAHTKR